MVCKASKAVFIFRLPCQGSLYAEIATPEGIALDIRCSYCDDLISNREWLRHVSGGPSQLRLQGSTSHCIGHIHSRSSTLSTTAHRLYAKGLSAKLRPLESVGYLRTIMAFSFGNLGNAMGSGSGGAAGASSSGPDLELIQTEGLGFLALAGDARLRLTSQWSPPPAANASLISIASRKGLVAAGGPDGVAIATTEAVRKAFEGPKEGDAETRSFQPQLKIALPIRLRQVAFTADETLLILSAEQGGGLAVYEVQALENGSTQAAFEVPTNAESLRALVPNPRPEKGELCAVVTEKGNLLMANMKNRSFAPGPNGQILRTQVSCVAWSTKGKQLVAGLGDGNMLQMTPEGEVKAEIPRPPGLDSSYFGKFRSSSESMALSLTKR